MRTERWMSVLLLSAVVLTGVARAHGQGRGHGHDRDDDDDQGRHHYYSDHDRDSMRGWYHDHDRDDRLPPGLAKRDQLPPGLERQLRVRGTLPPGLRKKMRPCPEEFEHRLPPPPPGCEHVVIGGHVVLMNRSTYMVMDIIHFEM